MSTHTNSAPPRWAGTTGVYQPRARESTALQVDGFRLKQPRRKAQSPGNGHPGLARSRWRARFRRERSSCSGSLLRLTSGRRAPRSPPGRHSPVHRSDRRRWVRRSSGQVTLRWGGGNRSLSRVTSSTAGSLLVPRYGPTVPTLWHSWAVGIRIPCRELRGANATLGGGSFAGYLVMKASCSPTSFVASLPSWLPVRARRARGSAPVRPPGTGCMPGRSRGCCERR